MTYLFIRLLGDKTRALPVDENSIYKQDKQG